MPKNWTNKEPEDWDCGDWEAYIDTADPDYAPEDDSVEGAFLWEFGTPIPTDVLAEVLS
jgi:hypothetical protein